MKKKIVFITGTRADFGKIKNVKILKVNHNTLFGETILSANQKNYAA